MTISQTKFPGIDLSTADCTCNRPNVSAAMGPNDILETVNREFAVYDKTGTLLFRTSLNNFLGTSDHLNEPRAIYDPTWNRWAMSLTDTSTPSLWLVYSGSSDPLGGWWFYHIGLPLQAGSIADFPMAGMNDEAFIYTSNNFDSSSTYVNSTAFAVPKARVYGGFGWGAGLAGVAFGTAPVIVGGIPTQQTSHGTYMIAADDANNLMYVYLWTDLGESPKLTYKGAIAYNWAAPPRRVNQPGTSKTLDPLDGRIAGVPTQLDNRVWFAHGVDAGSFPGVNYGFVAPGSMTIHFAPASQSPTSDDFNPSITAAVDLSSGKTHYWLNWAYTDTANNVPTRDVWAVGTGFAPQPKTGRFLSPAGSITSEPQFGEYSSIWPEYYSSGTCSVGTMVLAANESFESNGDWATNLDRIGYGCTP